MKIFLQKRVLPLLLAFSLTVGVVNFTTVDVEAVDPATLTVGAVALGILAVYSNIKKAGELGKDLQRIVCGIAGVPVPGAQGVIYDSSASFGDISKRVEVNEDWLFELHLRFLMDGTFNDDQTYTMIREVSTPEGLYKVIQVCYRYDNKDENGVTLNEKYQVFVMWDGQFLAAPVRELDDDDAHEKGIWQKYNSNSMQDISSMHFLTLAREYQRLQGVDCSIQLLDVGYVLTYSTGSAPYGTRYVYCNPFGAMYVAPAEDRVISSGRDHTDGDGNKTNLDIDVDADTITMPDGTELTLDGIYYNPETHTYYIDARDQSTHNVFNYSLTYNIQYTNVTYIGQTEEYNKYYELPYNLPDGRDSADLTAEELEQLNVSIDIVPYVRYSDDTSVRALYHFDGDTNDSSYWNYKNEFNWLLGASITYMDAGAFKGALYLDENNHKFNISLPSTLGSGDFTIQWRYYQSYTPTAASAPDGFVNIDGVDVFSWNGKKFFAGLGTTELAATSTGQWMELALIRNNGNMYYYVNGLCVGSVADSKRYGNNISFGFGALQQTYKYFDELRVLNFAYVDAGSSYTPTVVPHDTNLALVLPNSVEAVADEYWTFNADGNLLSPYNFTELDSFSFLEDVGGATSVSDTSSWKTGYNSVNAVVTLDVVDGFTLFSGPTSGSTSGKLFIPLYVAASNASAAESVFYGLNQTLGKSYVFSLMLYDGSLHSLPFTTCNGNGYSLLEQNSLPDGCSIKFDQLKSGSFGLNKVYGISLHIPSGCTLDVAYMELKEGSVPNTGHTFVSEVTGIDKDDMKTPTLAVKTDVFISGYQIGGMRPSVPEKGLVWALVESGVIKSLQIYNGSAWEAVDGRIWTGSRWVPLSSYNVLLLKDMYDITGVVTPDDYEYIYTQEGFWSWWQKSWLEFVSWLQGSGNGIGNGTGSDQQPDDSVIPPVDEDGDGGGEGWQFIDLLVLLKDGAWAVGKGIVVTVFDGISGLATAVDGVGGFFDSYSSGGGVFQIYEEGEGVWD